MGIIVKKEAYYGMNEQEIFSAADSFNSDLALERRRVETDIPGVEYRRERSVGGVWERIRINSEEGSKSIGRPLGCYDTLTVARMDILDSEEAEDAQDEVARELCRMCDIEDILPERILIVGLGNKMLTPDAIGPMAAGEVEATMHIKAANKEMFDSFECSEIAVISPDVTANSGIDTLDIIKGVSERIRPDVVFAIDALASRSPDRLGTTIQISSTGIFPGSGIGNRRGAINKQTLGVPVIAIGIPTVIHSGMFGKGAIGASQSYDMFVAPKEIDGIVRTGAKIIGGAINQAFGISY